MLNQRILRETDTASNSDIIRKPLTGPQKGISRLKGHALGEIKNTLHSRPTGISNKGATPSVKPVKNKFSIFDENSTSKNITKEGKTLNFSTCKPSHNSFEDDLNDFHDHALCEQADETCFNQKFAKYKLTDLQINNLVKAAKIFDLSENSDMNPLEEIEVPKENLVISETVLDDIFPIVLPPVFSDE